MLGYLSDRGGAPACDERSGHRPGCSHDQGLPAVSGRLASGRRSRVSSSEAPLLPSSLHWLTFVPMRVNQSALGARLRAHFRQHFAFCRKPVLLCLALLASASIP
jgi:hypothetical protein